MHGSSEARNLDITSNWELYGCEDRSLKTELYSIAGYSPCMNMIFALLCWVELFYKKEGLNGMPDMALRKGLKLKMEYQRNNLDKSASPYLRQHKDNPVWWQEWSRDVLDYAEAEGKVLFVSSGYSSCHWCHVMAEEAFSESATAAFLNSQFVSIKIDREQRPDIDRFLMGFLVSSTGSGGWPLNVFLSPDLKPFFAMTYAPPSPGGGMLSFLEILQKIKSFYEANRDRLSRFDMPAGREYSCIDAQQIAGRLLSGFDTVYGGIGTETKFPPHSHLLLMLYYYDINRDSGLKDMLALTLDKMLLGGLNDHLQGGFFRYCIDRQWTIPHFEKMLYDQAFLLWIYSMAFRSLGKDPYRACVEKITKCLEETFECGGLFYTSHDADTGHKEGESYLWSDDELGRVLDDDEYLRFTEVYDITKTGNFRGRNHLIKNRDSDIGEIEERLLAERRRRRQPFTDKKIITSVNFLTGVGFLHPYRYTGNRHLLGKAERILERLVDTHYKDGRLCHSSIDGVLQKEDFLEDYASALLLATFLYEETGKYLEYLKEFGEKLSGFRDTNGRWLEADHEDFLPVAAESLDHSLPSSASIAELATARAGILTGNPCKSVELRDPISSAFFNISALARNGAFYVIGSKERLSWKKVPVNSIQVSSEQLSICYNNKCSNKLPGGWR